MKRFIRHFRIYFKNNHPAYIVDENGDKYVFHRTSHNKFISGKNTWEVKPNPLENSNKPMHIAKRKQKDKKSRFSPFKLKLRIGIDANNLIIKKAGSTQANPDRVKAAQLKATSDTIKTKTKGLVNKKRK